MHTELALEFPLAFDAVIKLFYVDDTLTGADSIEQAIELRKQLQYLFSRGGFLLRNGTPVNQKCWNMSLLISEILIVCSRYLILKNILRKTLGIEWNAHSDHFRLTVSEIPPILQNACDDPAIFSLES